MAVALLCDDKMFYLPMLTTSAILPVDYLSNVDLINATFNELELYSDKTYEEFNEDTQETELIEFVPDAGYDFAQPWKWGITVIDADFNFNLEAGQLQGTGGLTVSSVALLRSSIRDNFTNWEEIAVFDIESTLRETYRDYLVESGVLYNYALQPISVKIDEQSGTRTEIRAPIGSKKYGMVNYDSVWMIGGDGVQMRLHYNPNVSEFRHVLKDSIVETIGSKYPFIIRNSNVGYRQFSFSGTIAVDIDLENNFIGDSYYKAMSETASGANEDIELIYKQFVENMSSPMGYGDNNYIREREFRRKLVQWFNDGEPKLYKSDTEGLILCKLTDVRLSPKNELGRTIYDFSCIITEIGEVSRDTLTKYGVIKSNYTLGEGRMY